MSQTASSSLSSKLHDTFEASLKVYEKKTGTSLLTHPLMTQLRDCDSPADILAILSSQVAQTTSPDDKLIKWLSPVVKVLTASSSVISECVGLVNLVQMILLRFNLRSHIYLGILTSKCHFHWCWCPPFGSYRPGSPSLGLALGAIWHRTYTGGKGRYCQPGCAHRHLRANWEYLQTARGICRGADD